MKKLIVPLAAVLALALPAVAQAHNASGSAVCGSATISWTQFASSGAGNGGVNAPTYAVTFVPDAGGAAYTQVYTGQASFTGASGSVTVTLPRANGVVSGITQWTSSQTRDHYDSGGPVVLGGKHVTGCTPTITTNANPSTATVGSQISDSATVKGLTTGPLAGGGSIGLSLIKWNLYGPNDPTCSGTPVATVSSGTVTGDGTYTSPPVTASAAGTYEWVATYPTDGFNPTVSGKCGDANESVTLTTTTTTSTTTSTTSTTTSTTSTTSTTTSTPPPPPAPKSGVQGAKTCTRSKITVFKRNLKGKAKRFRVTVRGAGITKVVFKIDNRTVRTLKRANAGKNTYTYIVDIAKSRFGTHVLKAVVSTHCGEPSTHSLRYARRIAARKVVPRFTG